MRARLRKLYNDISDTFWVVPALMVLGGILLAFLSLWLDRTGLLSQDIVSSTFLYDGGGTGARTLLGAIASSTIGVAGTVFTITIAALSLAAGQMGPRLLRNFVRDRGNQVALGTYLGTFSYALVVLRSVRTVEEGSFVPHLALSVGIALAFVCVAMLVYFVGHMAGRINVDTVVALVGDEMRDAIRRLTQEKAGDRPPPSSTWNGAVEVRNNARRGYLQELDASGLAKWAAEHDMAIRLAVRPGDYLFPGAAIGFATRAHEDTEAAVRNATALGAHRTSSADLEYAVRQLVEVAVRALSPGINDPNTAVSVLDSLGASLCDVAQVHLPTGVFAIDGMPRLVLPAADYAGLVDAMFNMIRQNAAGKPAVLIRMLEVLTAVVDVEKDEERRAELQRHAELVLGDGERSIPNPADLDDLKARFRFFGRMRDEGPLRSAPESGR